MFPVVVGALLGVTTTLVVVDGRLGVNVGLANVALGGRKELVLDVLVDNPIPPPPVDAGGGLEPPPE